MNKKTSKTKSIASTESWSRDPKNGRREKLSKTCKLVGFLDLQVEVKMKSAHGIFSFFQKEKVRGRNKTKKKKKKIQRLKKFPFEISIHPLIYKFVRLAVSSIN